MTAALMSLCSGYGGLDLGLSTVIDTELVAVSDLDPGASRILEHRYPQVPNLGDLTQIDWDQWAGVDVITAGYPCQPFSAAGLRKGTDDERHLFPHIAEGIRRVGPRLVILENVRGHLSMGFDAVLGTLANVGYDAKWLCLRASAVGAPHRRERLFIAATPRNAQGIRVESADHEGGRGSSRLAGQALSGRAGARVAPHPRGETIDVGTGLRPSDPTPLRGARPDDRHNAAAHPDRVRLDGVRSGHGGDPHRRNGEATDFGKYAPAVERWAGILGRPAPAATDRAPKGGRRLSARFEEWMMGLPEGWVTDVPDLTWREQVHALGNGVVPQQAAAASRYLLQVAA